MWKIRTARLKKVITGLLLGIGLGYSPAVMALSPLVDVGVVRSRENGQQWSEIAARLAVLGVDYCILDSQDWQEDADLEQVRVLFIPNVGNITGAQAIALDSWVQGGGKLIVTGPTGTLSASEVRSQLKNLFGAYWGFPISNPSTLVVKEMLSLPSIRRQKELSSTLIGGVVIPTDINSETAAVWLAEGKPPAVVMTDNSTYLGWRWGINNVSPVALDTAWLNLALKRYGVNPIGNLTTARSSQARPCNPKPTGPENPYPLVPDLDPSGQNQPVNGPLGVNERNHRQPNPTSSDNFLNSLAANLSLTAQNTSPNPEAVQMANLELAPQTISPQEVAGMMAELEELIYRVESTLIAAEAKHLKYGLPMTKVVEQAIATPNKPPSSNGGSQSQLRYSNRRAHQALEQARQVLDNFPQLVETDYPQARQRWLDARRSLWDNYPVDRHFAQPEVRAIWLDRGTIVKSSSKADLAQLFDRMAEAGINTVFFETLNASYPIYPSHIAPEQNPLTRGWDPLQAAVELAHERGMELHAWAWVFAAANQGHNQILNQPKNYLGPVLSRNPDWVLKDQNGQVFNKTPGFKKAFYDPANPGVREYLLALLEEIATRYEVDGIQLDYIRYPFQDNHSKQVFGYTNSSRYLFKQAIGIDPVKISRSSHLWSQWMGFRLQQVDSFVAEASSRLKQKRPDLIISAAVFPMERRERLFTLQQNWEEWIYSQWVDMIVLMTYAMHTGSFEERTKPLYDYSEQATSLIVPGIRLLNVPDTETLDQMQLLRNMPASGYALFAAENFNPNLQVMFKQTQGSSQQTEEPLPYRQPFQAAFSRYQALQQEWNFLLINHQIAFEPRYLREWSREADALANSFQKLASNPSEQNFRAAQSALSSFRGKLAKYLPKHQQQQPLQVKSWENRLIALENLLKYGQRTILDPNSRVARQ
jgi:uncharacterized lipoprotein YddW (UPF0748 family)